MAWAAKMAVNGRFSLGGRLCHCGSMATSAGSEDILHINHSFKPFILGSGVTDGKGKGSIRLP